MAADAEAATHADVEAEVERVGGSVDISDPSFHGAGGEELGEALLDVETCGCFSVVAHPDLIGVAEDAIVSAATTTRAALPDDVGMALAERSPDVVEAMDIASPQLAGIARSVWPARLTDVTIHIPFDEGNVVLGKKAIDDLDEVALDVGAGEIEDELMAELSAGAGGEVDDPVRMRAVEITIGIDHLRLDPETEGHAKLFDAIDERSKAVGEFLRIGPPIAKTGGIALAALEPAVIHDEELDAHLRGEFGKRTLGDLIDVEVSRFPGVVENGVNGVAVWQDGIAHVIVQETAGGTEALCGEAPEAVRGAAGLAGFERSHKSPVVESDAGARGPEARHLGDERRSLG